MNFLLQWFAAFLYPDLNNDKKKINYNVKEFAVPTGKRAMVE